MDISIDESDNKDQPINQSISTQLYYIQSLHNDIQISMEVSADFVSVLHSSHPAEDMSLSLTFCVVWFKHRLFPKKMD